MDPPPILAVDRQSFFRDPSNTYAKIDEWVKGTGKALFHANPATPGLRIELWANGFKQDKEPFCEHSIIDGWGYRHSLIALIRAEFDGWPELELITMAMYPNERIWTY